MHLRHWKLPGKSTHMLSKGDDNITTDVIVKDIKDVRVLVAM